MDTLAEHLSTKGPWLLFVWLALLFVKTHLRDKAFRWHLDTRRGELAIAEVYDWEALHHIHCVARSFYSRAKFDASVMGTFFAFPASPLRFSEHFDYGDLYVPKAVCLRFRDAAMVCVLNDSCACFSLEKDRLFPRIKGPLSPLQIREVMARLAYLNLLMKERPHFFSEFDGGTYRIGAIHPHSIEVEKWDPEVYGQFLYLACADWLESCRNPEIEITKEHVRRGQYTFLFDQKGEFIRDQLIFLDKGEDAEQSR